MKFLEKCGFDVLPNGGIILGVILSTIVLIFTTSTASSFYIKHLIICLAGYAFGCILANAMYKLVYFVCKKIKNK